MRKPKPRKGESREAYTRRVMNDTVVKNQMPEREKRKRLADSYWHGYGDKKKNRDSDAP